jgi:hypothetical protein
MPAEHGGVSLSGRVKWIETDSKHDCSRIDFDVAFQLHTEKRIASSNRTDSRTEEEVNPLLRLGFAHQLVCNARTAESATVGGLTAELRREASYTIFSLNNRNTRAGIRGRKRCGQTRDPTAYHEKICLHLSSLQRDKNRHCQSNRRENTPGSTCTVQASRKQAD